MVGSEGFGWVNENKGQRRPKWGYVSTVPESEIRFRVDTRATAFSLSPSSTSSSSLQLVQNVTAEKVEKAPNQ